MIPIHELLSRIRWDPEFARGTFELGYYDRAEDRIVQVPLNHVHFPAESPRTFEIAEPGGQTRRIPFHRVREVRRDGLSIWRRDPGPEGRQRACTK